MSTYALDPEAQRDLEGYLAQIVADDVMAALRQEDRIALALDQLAEQPRIGRESRIAAHPTAVRWHPLRDTPLVAIYLEVPTGIRVLRVFHTSREPVLR